MTDPDRRNVPAYTPEKIDALKADAERATAECEDWTKAEVDSEETAEELRDFLAKLGAIQKKATEAHREDKAPWLAGGREVDAAYAPIRDRLERLIKRVKPILNAWLDRKERERQERERAAAEAARKRQEEADRQARLAARSKSIEAEEAAERAAKEAEMAAKEAERIARDKVRIASATGGAKAAGYRTRRVAALRDLNQAYLHYREVRRRELEDFLTGLANAEVRAKDGPEEIPGFDIRVERSV